MGTQEEEAFGHLRRPEGSGCFESEVDDPSNGALHDSAPLGNALLLEVTVLEVTVLHALCVFVEVSQFIEHLLVAEYLLGDSIG